MSDGLSEREQAVLSWLKQGLSNKEIGLALSISPRTVQKHLQRVYQQLGVQTWADEERYRRNPVGSFATYEPAAGRGVLAGSTVKGTAGHNGPCTHGVHR